MKDINPVGWFEIYVDNMERAKIFYESVLKLELTEMPNPTDDGAQMLSFPMQMEAYGAPGALVKMEGFKAGGNSTLIYFSSQDCSIEEGRVKEAGGKIFKSKQSIGEYGYMVLAVDTEGNMIGIHSMS